MAIANSEARNTVYVAIVDAGKKSMQPAMYTVRPMRRPVLYEVRRMTREAGIAMTK